MAAALVGWQAALAAARPAALLDLCYRTLFLFQAAAMDLLPDGARAPRAAGWGELCAALDQSAAALREHGGPWSRRLPATLRRAAPAELPVAALLAELREIAALWPWTHLAGLRPALLDGPAAASAPRRKAAGSYYTPPAVAAALLDLALEPLLSGCAPATLLDLRVLDPACGVGDLLLAAAERIVARWSAATGGDPGVGLRRLLSQGLRGGDRDPLAVELCRARAWLLAARPGQWPANLLRAVRCTDALRRGARRGLQGWQGLLSPAADFDLVLGNPPYARLPAAGSRARRRIDATYGPEWGRGNLAALFLPAGLAALRPGGSLGYVLPRSFSHVLAYAPLREALHEQAALRGVADLGRAFEGVGLEQLLLVVEPAGAASAYPTWRSTGPVALRAQGSVDPGVARRVGTWGLRLSPSAQVLLQLLEARCVPLRALCAQDRGRAEIFRGPGLQRQARYGPCPGPGWRPLVGGRNLSSFALWPQSDEPWAWVDDAALRPRDRRALERQGLERIVCKNVVSSKVRVEATLLGAEIGSLDTVNNVVLLERDPDATAYVLGVLNSSLLAWMLAEVVFDGSELTMHLDEGYLGRLLVVPWAGEAWQREVAALARDLLSARPRKRRKGVDNLLELQQDALRATDERIEDALGLGRPERAMVERNRRYR